MAVRKSPLRKYIENGARLLDERVPDWPTRIDLKKLKLGSPMFCVVGQLYGHSYYEGIVELGVEGDERFYGFDVLQKDALGTYYTYETLTLQWKKYIKERIAQWQ